jgi:hypothetical protein
MCPVCPGGICDDRHQTTQKGVKPPKDLLQEEEDELEKMEQAGNGGKTKVNEFQKKEHDYFMYRYNTFGRNLDAKAFYRLQAGFAPHEEDDVLAEVEIVSQYSIFPHFIFYFSEK